MLLVCIFTLSYIKGVLGDIKRKRFWACPCGPGYPLQVLAPEKGAAGFPFLSLTQHPAHERPGRMKAKTNKQGYKQPTAESTQRSQKLFPLSAKS
ncbi:hypothetical protein DSL64_28345 [Dyadobacter luteus]|uniref:Uncharacterized protein n=1 Tax=Dyadobacter luteus TaxID=2259619 RepID=A0A3D8Y5L5_9BACT|nr:hypothetical protein DSL64_28345 [Dyadobacter luteus]